MTFFSFDKDEDISTHAACSFILTNLKGAFMNAHVNENCIGCGLCVSTCPEVFSMTDSGVAKAIGDFSTEQVNSVLEAANCCPVEAIEVD